VVLLASLVKGVALALVWVIFLSTEGFWMGAIRYILIEAVVAAVLAPSIFAVLRRGQTYLERVQIPGLYYR
jgi:hypothetical protein